MVMVLEVTPVVSPAVEPPVVAAVVPLVVDPVGAAVVVLPELDELPHAVATRPTASRLATPQRPIRWLRQDAAAFDQ